MDYKKYNNIKLAVGISETILSFILILLFIATGLSLQLEQYLTGLSGNSYIVFVLFAAVTGAGFSIVFFPFSFYSGFYLEHRFNLSNQTFVKWILEGLKSLLVASVIGIPVLLVFYYVINTFGSYWWLPFAVFIFILSVLLAKIVPIFILPLFYKITPLENEEIKKRIIGLSKGTKLKVENVFRFDMSKNTKKANAAFTGLGKTKKVILGDTLLDNYSVDEIETVLAHEIGHYEKKHIIKNIVLNTVLNFFTLYMIALIYEELLPVFGFSELTQIAALPMLVLLSIIISLLLTPVLNSISRKYEYEADKYAIEKTGKGEVFIGTLEKLTEQNLGDKEPHPFVEWFFYSHPSIKRRVAFINSLVKNRDEE
ncbi:MAG TPA: M48 family metallopeptidase [Ignavibacteriaceae bacterium]|jgi:STE24 endopeptidase|nr:M48 family metallopeptidase [Ignavibacteriaceae bacterium]